MKMNELLTEVAQVTVGEIEPITVSERDGGFLVNSSAKKGPTLDTLFRVWKEFNGKRGIEIKGKSGKVLDLGTVLRNRPNGFIIIAKNPEGMKEKIEAAIEKATANVKKLQKSDAAYKEKAPERKKAKAQYAATKRKEDLAEYAKKYGKGTWNRVTYRQEGGDDGYAYVVRVDGYPKWKGLTQREAMYYKEREVDEIAKKEKLGKYAK